MVRFFALAVHIFCGSRVPLYEWYWHDGKSVYRCVTRKSFLCIFGFTSLSDFFELFRCNGVVCSFLGNFLFFLLCFCPYSAYYLWSTGIFAIVLYFCVWKENEMMYFLIGFICFFAGYVIGTFFTSFLMKQKVVNGI